MKGEGTTSEIVFVVNLMVFIYYYLPKCLLTDRYISYVNVLRMIQ